MDVTVIDNETPGVVLTQSGGSTIVIGDDPNTAADETLLITSQDSYTIRLTKRPDGTVTIAVLTDGLTDVVSIGGAPVVIAEIGQPDAGQWSGEATAAADPEPSDPSGLGGRRITRDDSSSWLADGFSEGQRVRVYNADNLAEFVDLKIAIIRGLNATFDETLQFTSEGVTPGWWTTATAFDVVRLAAVATFDPTTWYAEQTVVLKADPLYSQPLVRQGSKTYPATTHLLSRIQGPLSVEGGVTGADRSLRDRGQAPRRAGRAQLLDRVPGPRVPPDRRPQHLQRLQPPEHLRRADLDEPVRVRHGRRPDLRRQQPLRRADHLPWRDQLRLPGLERHPVRDRRCNLHHRGAQHPARPGQRPPRRAGHPQPGVGRTRRRHAQHRRPGHPGRRGGGRHRAPEAPSPGPAAAGSPTGSSPDNS